VGGGGARARVCTVCMRLQGGGRSQLTETPLHIFFLLNEKVIRIRILNKKSKENFSLNRGKIVWCFYSDKRAAS
jgi:hypothetical protein